MKEILFRGKRKDTHEWVMGGYCEEADSGRTHIAFWNSFGVGFLDFTEVYPKSVGQYTGLKDKNGTKIFEGDIVRRNIINNAKAVEFYKGRFYPFIAFPEYNCWNEDECEIIGNIHDNPELIGGT